MLRFFERELVESNGVMDVTIADEQIFYGGGYGLREKIIFAGMPQRTWRTLSSCPS